MICIRWNIRWLVWIQALTIPQLRRLSSLIEDSIRRCNEERVQCEMERGEAMYEIGNLLHESVVVSADEVRQFGFLVSVICINKAPLPPIDIVWATMIVWRIRGKIIRTVLCCVLYDTCAQWCAYTYEQFFKRPLNRCSVVVVWADLTGECWLNRFRFSFCAFV